MSNINRKEGKSEFTEVIIVNFDLVDIDPEATKAKPKATRDLRGIS
ncbi:MAG: hypothetical protein RBQ67_03710 [Candidatus Cloacimonadaceae bacterium]|nr:hypothetical protein [Candidatus Cloacimonadaceae bacterium]